MRSTALANPLEAVRLLYDRILSNDEEGLNALLTDDLVVVHQGVRNPELPFYNVFHGRAGFFEWLKALFNTVELNLFEPTYFVSDGQKVNVHVREGSLVKASKATHCIENFHAFHVNEALEIQRVKIISDPLTVCNSLHGKPSEHFEPKHRQLAIHVEDYPFDRAYNEALAEKALYCISRGDHKPLSEIFSIDAEFIINGDEAVVPFAGKHSGMVSITDFMKKFSPDVSHTLKDYTVSEGNKTDVHFSMQGVSAVTGKRFSHDAVVAFQYNREGRIVYAFFHMNTFEIQQAYSG